MTREWLHDLFAEAEATLLAKNADYAGGGDPHAQFKRVATALTRPAREITPYDVWLVYAHKHWDALVTAAGRGGRTNSETLRSRVVDVINYAALLLSMTIEDTVPATVPRKEVEL